MDQAMVAKSRSDYREALDAAIAEERGERGFKPLEPKDRMPVEAETKLSRTDPRSGDMVSDGKPKGFFYLDHRTVDGRLGIITDTFATPANVHDPIVYLCRPDRQRERIGFRVAAVGWMPDMPRPTAMTIGTIVGSCHLPAVPAARFLHERRQAPARHHPPCLAGCPRTM